MKNRWSDAEAAAFVERYAARWGEDLALRVYSSRLIGTESALVLHGGGNTSVKSTYVNLLGDEVPAVFVKGSGWNLGDIEPQGLPGVDLHYLRRLVKVPTLTDEDMVNEQRTHMFDASAPNPSIEALLHAFFPAKFVDHSHADAILALTNHPDGEQLVRAALGDDLCLVPYVKPGFDLAVLAARCFEEMPDCTGMVLMQHGLFTWGETAKESYDRHIELVTKAEAYLAARPGPREPRPGPAAVAAARVRAARIGPLLRGALGEDGQGWILEHRASPDVLAWVGSDRLDRWVAAGPLTPDHVIRTKSYACVVRVDGSSEEADKAAILRAVRSFREAYDRTFEEQSARVPGSFTKLDSTPRVLLVPGVGLFGVGESPGAARICADITEHTLEVKELCEGLGPFQGLPDDLIFEIEYWSLEQAKLGGKKPAALAGRVALVTGGAGAIGIGVARSLLGAGALVVLADRDPAALQRAAGILKGKSSVVTVEMDVTDAESVAAGFRTAALAFGGVDVVVPNAGVAHSAPIAELDEADFRRVMEVNAHGVFLTVREAARQLIRQGTGGQIVLISSKNVFGPGAQFAAYSASKAAAHQLCKVAALELAPHGIAVNMVNPDAVFSQDGVQSGLWATVGPDRARAKGIAAEDLQEHYRQRNLLKATVTGEHVGRAVVFFASGQTPTTGASLPVDGGVENAFPR
jgi:rhamnulose-1-phosphate aldolase/alcohol dehydrogenase